MSILSRIASIPKKRSTLWANDILMQMQKTQNFAPKVPPFDATTVADFLDLGVVWDCIEPDEEGAIAARILPQQRLIGNQRTDSRKTAGLHRIDDRPRNLATGCYTSIKTKQTALWNSWN